MVPSVPNESAQIIARIYMQKTETLQVDPNTTEPYFEITIWIHTCNEKYFPTVYNFPIFEIVCKKSHFQDNNFPIICLVLHASPKGTRNQNLRPISNLFWSHNPMTVSELANKFLLKITFFKISTIISIYVKFQYLDIQVSVLVTENTLELALTIRI